LATIYYNSIMHTTMKMSLFELVLRKEAYGPSHSHGEEGPFQINHKNERARIIICSSQESPRRSS
jgi:hypothetical protein